MDLVLPDSIVFIGCLVALMIIGSVLMKAWKATSRWLVPLLCVIALFIAWNFSPLGDFVMTTWRMNT